MKGISVNIITTIKAWIIRQAKQKSTWIGTIIASFVFIWQFISNDVAAIIINQVHYPWAIILIKVALGLFGVGCMIYNENKNFD